MNIKEYQTIIEKTSVYPKEIGLAYCGLGLAGETGEVLEKIKKLYRDNPRLLALIKDKNSHYYSDVIDFKSDIKKELGDVLWYLTAISNELNISLEDIMETNYNKLIKRRETNTLHGSGDNREEI
jgi:NTP pyrophosphatase (non-canonical NTP hydrolase)